MSSRIRFRLLAIAVLVEALAAFVACSDDQSPAAPGSDGGAPQGDTGVPTPGSPTTGDGGGDAGGESPADAALGPACRSSGWCWENPTLDGEHLTGVWGASAADVWAVGLAGNIFHRTAGGWSRATSPTTYDLNAIWGPSATDVWAVGGHGMIVHGDGTTWTVRSTADAGSPDSFNQLRSVHGTSATDVWAVGDSGLILHNDGSGWTSRSVDAGAPAPFASYWTSVFAKAADDVWVVGLGNGSPVQLAHWTGGGWVLEPLIAADASAPWMGNLRGVWVAPSGEVFAVGEDPSTSTSYVFERVAGTWTQAPLPAGTFRSIWGTSATDVWAAGADGAIAHFDGGQWTASTPAPRGVSLEAIGTAGADAWIVGEGGTFLQLSGTTWTPAPAETSVTRASLSAISLVSTDEAWAVGDTVLRRTATGWAVDDALEDGGVLEKQSLNGVSALATNDVWASSALGGAFHWDGTKWSSKSEFSGGGAIGALNDISASGPNDVWAVSGAGVLHYTGATWSTVTLTEADGSVVSAPFFFTVIARSPTDVWAGGPFTVVHYDGTSWRKLNEPGTGASIQGPASGLAPQSATDLWVTTGFNGGTSALTFHWDGATFTSASLPGDWTDGLTFSKMASSSPSDIWVVAVGGIGHYDGKAWSFSDRPSAALHGIAAKDGHTWVVGADGAILHHAP